MITICINLTARHGKKSELEHAIRALVDKIDKEAGCIECRMYKDFEQKNEFVIMERWNDERMAMKHLESESLAVLSGASSLLTYEQNVSVDRFPSTEHMEKAFEQKIKRPKQ